MGCIKSLLVMSVVFSPLVMTACKENESKQEEVESSSLEQISLETMADQVSYLLGYSSAKQVSEAGLTLNSDILLQAIKDAQNGSDALISDDEVRKVSAEFQKLIQENRLLQVRENNERLGLEYRNQHAQKEGVVITESGIQYEILSSGEADGKKPTESDSVKVHYHGTSIDGKVFDSSIDRGEAVTFAVNQVIAGWTEVLQLMHEGDKWRVVIPSELAYPNGTRAIAPGSTLLFDIELLEINPES